LTPAFRPKNVTIKNNTFFAKIADQITFLLEYLGEPDLVETGWLNSDDNYYLRPINEGETMLIAKKDYSVFGNKKLQWWQKYSSQDKQSKTSPKSTVHAVDFRFEYNASTSLKKVPLDYQYIDVTGRAYNGTLSLAPYSSIILIRDR
jgi:hypothetical protein